MRATLSRLLPGVVAPPKAKIEKYVFVFTYGRSGSTLLMGLLNSLDGYCIRGENNNALYQLFEFNRHIEEARTNSLRNSERPSHPWFGLNLYDPEAARIQQRDMFVSTLLHPEPHHRVTGFKEIRFSEKDVPEFEAYIDYVRATFAPCKIVFNHRKLESVAKSGWWANMPEGLNKLKAVEDRLQSIPASNDIYHFSYDAFCADPTYAKGLMEFLGEPYDAAAVKHVLDVRHSY